MEKLLKKLGLVSAVIGAQWGDEGKGKVVDILAEHFDVIARACGGANAGHTIVVNGQKHVFHLLPAGSLHEGKPVVLGAGMVIHLPTLFEEIETLEKAGISIMERLYISGSAHILFDFHKEIDAKLEEWRTAQKGEGIGTTKRGIGPAYMDKAARSGIRMESLLGDANKDLQERIELVQKQFGISVDVKKEVEVLSKAVDQLADHLCDAPRFLHEMLQIKNTVLIEGAQATLLDIDHGTYPFVTSSATTLAGALQGLGLAPNRVTSSVGVAKAYCTRVGSGTFATEVEGELGDKLRERGGEYGATTGRPRRCGWLDLGDLKYAALLNGFTCWNITKLDVLDDLKEIPVSLDSTSGTPDYKNLPGWEESTRGITDWKKLPTNAQKYIEFIEEQTGIPVALIGTGQGREEMIVR